MPKKKKTTTSGELVMVKSVRRTCSRRMKFCVYGGLGDTFNRQRRMPIQGHCLPILSHNMKKCTVGRLKDSFFLHFGL